MALNLIVVTGRFTKDPELSRTSNGTAVTSFSLAVQRDFKNKEGNFEVDFIPCVAWKNTAEFASKYFQKGTMATVSGRLQIRPYVDRAGNKRMVSEIIVSNIYFGETIKKETYVSENQKNNNENEEDFAEVSDEEFDLPF